MRDISAQTFYYFTLKNKCSEYLSKTKNVPIALCMYVYVDYSSLTELVSNPNRNIVKLAHVQDTKRDEIFVPIDIQNFVNIWSSKLHLTAC